MIHTIVSPEDEPHDKVCKVARDFDIHSGPTLSPFSTARQYRTGDVLIIVLKSVADQLAKVGLVKLET